MSSTNDVVSNRWDPSIAQSVPNFTQLVLHSKSYTRAHRLLAELFICYRMIQ